jgi:hypothetical protein
MKISKMRKQGKITKTNYTTWYVSYCLKISHLPSTQHAAWEQLPLRENILRPTARVLQWYVTYHQWRRLDSRQGRLQSHCVRGDEDKILGISRESNPGPSSK